MHAANEPAQPLDGETLLGGILEFWTPVTGFDPEKLEKSWKKRELTEAEIESMEKTLVISRNGNADPRPVFQLLSDALQSGYGKRANAQAKEIVRRIVARGDEAGMLVLSGLIEEVFFRPADSKVMAAREFIYAVMGEALNGDLGRKAINAVRNLAEFIERSNKRSYSFTVYFQFIAHALEGGHGDNAQAAAGNLLAKHVRNALRASADYPTRERGEAGFEDYAKNCILDAFARKEPDDAVKSEVCRLIHSLLGLKTSRTGRNAKEFLWRVLELSHAGSNEALGIVAFMRKTLKGKYEFEPASRQAQHAVAEITVRHALQRNEWMPGDDNSYGMCQSLMEEGLANQFGRSYGIHNVMSSSFCDALNGKYGRWGAMDHAVQFMLNAELDATQPLAKLKSYAMACSLDGSCGRVARANAAIVAIISSPLEGLDALLWQFIESGIFTGRNAKIILGAIADFSRCGYYDTKQYHNQYLDDQKQAGIRLLDALELVAPKVPAPLKEKAIDIAVAEFTKDLEQQLGIGNADADKLAVLRRTLRQELRAAPNPVTHMRGYVSQVQARKLS